MASDTILDEFAGQGGSYILDPKTGKRVRVEAPTREAPAPAVAAEAPTPDGPSPATGEGERAGEAPAPVPDESHTVAPLRGRRKPTDDQGS